MKAIKKVFKQIYEEDKKREQLTELKNYFEATIFNVLNCKVGKELNF